MLKIWLPLNGDLHNQGLDNVTVTNNGATVNNAGKIGKCYEFNGSTYMKVSLQNLSEYSTTTCSMCVWAKFPSASSGNKQLLNIGTSYGWNNIRFGILYQTGAAKALTSISDGSSHYVRYSCNANIIENDWNHVTAVYNNRILKIYINGVLANTFTTTYDISFTGITELGIGAAPNGAEKFTGSLCDVRVYSHALSAKEIKEISKGLVLHYPLNRGGFGQDNLCSKQLGDVTWGNWQNNSTWTTNNIREKIEIDGKIWGHIHQIEQTGYGGWACAPTSNGIEVVPGKKYTISALAKAGSATNAKIIFWCHWRSTEGGANLSQNSSFVDLSQTAKRVSVTWTVPTNASYTVNRINLMIGTCNYADNEIYFTDIKFEEGSTATPWVPNSADPLYSAMGLDSNVEYDVSGYQRNGTTNNITCNSDSPRYNVSSVFNGTNSYIKVNSNDWMVQGIEEATINIWGYMDDWTKWGGRRLFSCTESGGFNLELLDSRMKMALSVYTNAAKTSNGYIPTVDRVSIDYTALSSGWHMFTCVYTTSGCKFYVDGVLEDEKEYTSYGIHYYANARLFLGCEANGANPVSPYFNGMMSDFRIYYTALNDSDILALYNTPASIASNGTLLTQGEISEV